MLSKLSEGNTASADSARRVYIPKRDGRQRPISIPVLKNKIVQRATATVLQAIYETDFDGMIEQTLGVRKAPETANEKAIIATPNRVTTSLFIFWINPGSNVLLMAV